MNDLAIAKIVEGIRGTPFQGDLFLVGGAVRDELLGFESKNDFDLVTRGDALALARLLADRKVSKIAPVTYPRFGTAMIRVDGAQIELVTARRESYDEESRKPHVEPASYEEDARRRDFTVNALLRDIETGQVLDPLGQGIEDLKQRLLRTPLEPAATFREDPLRMLRAIRFRWQLGFAYAPGLENAIQSAAERLQIISFERIRDELLKMLSRPSGADALNDLARLGLLQVISPELAQMQGVEQGNYHHLDVWDHTLLVIRNLWKIEPSPSLPLVLSALFHDIGKPPTRTKDAEGRTRFFDHAEVGGRMTAEVLRRWKLPDRDIEPVVTLVRGHMRLGSAPEFTASAARRLIRDLGDQVDDLTLLVEADVASLKPGVLKMNLAPIRAQIETARRQTPVATLEPPLSGEEIMSLLKLEPGPEVGQCKKLLLDKVLDGSLQPGDKQGAEVILRQEFKPKPQP